jgi:hypothetical protein
MSIDINVPVPVFEDTNVVADSASTTTSTTAQPNSDLDAMQIELNTIMGVLDETQLQIPEGEYLRGMNALGSLHRIKNKIALNQNSRYTTRREIFDISADETFGDAVIDLVDDLLREIVGFVPSDDEQLVEPGEEFLFITQIQQYQPTEGQPGYGVNPIIMHHAIQVIYEHVMSQMIDELEIIRPASCECGWRGKQGNWDRHTKNKRHLNWVAQEEMKMKESETAESSSDDDSDHNDSDHNDSESDTVGRRQHLIRRRMIMHDESRHR